MQIEYIENDPSFQKDLKRLLKKYRTLEGDLENLKIHSIDLYHIHSKNNYSIVEITGKKIYKIFKVKKIACKALKGYGVQSGLRLIYAFNIETFEITFLELYHKNEKENEDKEKIKRFLSLI